MVIEYTRSKSSGGDCWYFRVREGAKVAQTKKAWICNVDKDADGNVLGIEVIE